jgi:hypothetical protein
VRRRAAGAVLVLGTVAMVVLSWWSKARCLEPGAWSQGRQFTEHCYTDLAPLWFGRGLADGSGPWGAEPLEYPVLLVVQVWATARAVHLLPGDASVQGFLAVSAVVAVVQALGILLLLRRAGLPVSRLAWWAGAPALGLYALYNWDLLPLLLLVAAVAAHREDRHALAGVLAGLGAAAKLFPALLVPVVVLALLRRRRPRDAAVHALAAAAAWTAVNLPAALAAPQAWGRFFALNRERGAHVDSLWSLLSALTGVPVPAEQLNVLGPVLLAVGALAVAAFGVRRLPPEHTWRLVLPLLVVFLLTNKVYSPQFSLWLVPLMLLCGTRTPPLLAAVLADVLVFSVELPVLGGRAGFEPGLPYWVLGAAVALRAAALTWVAAETVRGAGLSPRSSATAGAREQAPTAASP